MAKIRERGRLQGLDVGEQPLPFRDPITGEITGFDVDMAGEVARDIRRQRQVEYRIPSSSDRSPRCRRTPRHRGQDHDDHLRTPQAGQLSTAYFIANQRILAPPRVG